MNSIDYIVTVAPVKGCDILGSKWRVIFGISCVGSRKYGEGEKIWVTMTRAKWCWLDNWVRASPKWQVLWGVSGMPWSVPTKSGARKDNWRQGCGDRRLIDAHREQRLVHLVWSDRRAKKGLKSLMLAMMERCQNAQCIVVCGIWGCVATDQTECPWWPLSIAKSPYQWGCGISELDHGAMEERFPVWWITFSFRSGGWPGACATFPWERDCNRM